MNGVDTPWMDAASWCAGVARMECCPSDRLWLSFGCDACGRRYERTFRYPAEALITRSLDALRELVSDALVTCPAHVDEAEHRTAGACECGAPAHRSRTSAAALLRPMIGTGALLIVAEAHDGERGLFKLDEGRAEPIAITDVASAFGRPLTLAAPMEELASRPGAHRSIERGVWLFTERGAASLSTAIRARLGDARRVVVHLDASTAAPEIARALEDGLAMALVVEHDHLLASMRAWARARLSADVRELDGARLELVTQRGRWPIAAGAVALEMTQRRTLLTDACARVLADAAEALADRLATLQAMVELVPGASFDVEGHVATPTGPDGRVGSPVDLATLPAGLHAQPTDELAREAAFHFDVAPAWADRARVCPCGAAARVELRAIPWPWRGEPGARPWAVEHSDDRAVVIALSCDRHVRILPESTLRRMNLSLRGER